MTDLTERLRARAASHASLKGKGLPAEPWPELFAEAADEIDRLRAEIDRLQSDRASRLERAIDALQETEK